MAAAEFDALYDAHRGNIVALAYTYTGDLAAAQDLAQDAFCKLWQQWSKIVEYDDPVAWVRRVVRNLATSRWRRISVAAAHLVRERPADEPGIDPSRVAVIAAVRQLPVQQRTAVALHYLLDLPLADVAREMDVPIGTVKSWLHRARIALADLLGDDVRDKEVSEK